MKSGHQEIVQKAIAFMEANLLSPPSMKALAGKMGYSASYLRRIFRKNTGKGLMAYLVDLRIDRAKKLLQDTKLSIKDIAYETGFGSPTGFFLTFRKKTGCSPTKYRGSLGLAEEKSAGLIQANGAEKIWHDAGWKDSRWNPAFEIAEGTWSQADGIVSGGSDKNARLFCREPLPENFHLSMEVQVVPQTGLHSNEIHLELRGRKPGISYCVFVLGGHGGQDGEFRPHGLTRQINPKAVPVPGKWHRLDLELRDEEIGLCMDGATLFSHKDPFPLPYSHRSQLSFGTFDGRVRLRKLTVKDFGFLPLVRNVRQGDSLYNGGLFAEARDFYQRLLAISSSPAEIMELRYKIGRCLMKETVFFQARVWLEKVVALPEALFWAGQMQLAILELDILEHKLGDLSQKTRALFRVESLRHGTREVIEEAAFGLIRHGFFERAASLQDALFNAEHSQSLAGNRAATNLAETLLLWRRYGESEKLLRCVCDHANSWKWNPHAFFSLCDNLALQGETSKWLEVLNQIGKRRLVDDLSCRLLVYRAFYARANRQLKKALATLADVRRNFPKETHWCCYAELLRSQIFCCTGNLDQARKSLKDAQLLDSQIPHLSPGSRCRWFYPPELSCGNYKKAGEILLASAIARQDHYQGAELSIKAGIMFTLAGNKDKALGIWKRTGALYLPERFNFLGPFAEALAKGNTSTVEEMPYTAQMRSEMFYLVGLLCDKCGDSSRARELFEKSAREDLLLNWPACLAGQRLCTLSLLSDSAAPN